MQDEKMGFDSLPEKVSTILIKIERLEKILSHFPDVTEEHSDEELLTIEGASKFTSLARQTIYGLVSERKIPFIKRENSKRLYFSKKELREWILKGRKNTMKPVKTQNHMYR